MGEPLNRVTIITRREKTEELRQALVELGVNGITVTMVEGCGVQYAVVRYFRGVKAEMRLLPKVMFEMVISDIPVESVVKAARDVLYTGNIGDGKIFVEEELAVYKVRTDEEGKNAL